MADPYSLTTCMEAEAERIYCLLHWADMRERKPVRSFLLHELAESESLLRQAIAYIEQLQREAVNG